MDKHIVTLSGLSLGASFTVETDDLFGETLIIDPQKFDYFCGHSAVNFGSYFQFDGAYVFKVDVCCNTEPVVKLEMVVDTVFAADATKTTFRWPQANALIPAGCKAIKAAEFAVEWGKLYMKTTAGMFLHTMYEADAVLTLRSAYMQAFKDYDPFHRMTPMGGEVEIEGETAPSHVAEMIDYPDGSTVYLTPDGIGYIEPENVVYADDDDDDERSSMKVMDASPVEGYQMVSLLTH